MSVDMRNSEGYLDLTAYEAIKKVEQEQRSGRAFRPIVYICSPYAGDVKANVLNARRYCHFAVQKDCIPIASHLFFPQFMGYCFSDVFPRSGRRDPPTPPHRFLCRYRNRVRRCGTDETQYLRLPRSTL